MATTTNLGKVVITPRGTYSPSTAYVALDIIEYNGSGYLVLAPVTGVTPPNATYYMLLAAKGVKGDTGQAATVTVGTVGSLPAGSTPTVTNTGTANNAIFNFSLTQGNNWYTGDAITGTSTTPTAYATGITLAGVGDLYLNPSITADQGNIYQCTTGGNAATALWIYVGNITGTLAGAVAYTAQTPTSGQQIQARANINAASTTHASTHATSGADALTPAAIGAAASGHAHGSITNAGKIGTTADLPVFTGTGGAIGIKSKADAKIALDIDPRGFEYDGREIPLTWAQIKAKVAAGDFTGLRVGDYKDITLSGTFYDAAAGANKTITNNVFRMEIAGIDSYYRYADTSVPHHIDFISRDCLAGNLLYNATGTNSGAYIGSALFTTLNGANGLQSLLPSDVAAVILVKRGLTEVKTGASASSWAWNDMGKLWLPTEQEVWGHVTWAEHGYGGGLSVQYPIFRDGLRHIVKGDGNGGGRCHWWCASSMAGSAADFCSVTNAGAPSATSATSAGVRVPLCFRVA